MRGLRYICSIQKNPHIWGNARKLNNNSEIMKYEISNKYGVIPWLSLIAQNDSDKKNLTEIKKELDLKKARFNCTQLGDAIVGISLQLQLQES